MADATSKAYDFPGTTLPVDVSAFKDGFSYVTYVGVNTKDVVVYLKPQSAAGKMTGTMGADKFANLSDVRGTVHLAINGPSIAGNLIDISLTTLLGESVPTHIDLGGSTQTDIDLPDGIVIGLGSQMFKQTYSVQSDPGLRAVWSLGGNVVLSDVLGVVSSATGGGDIDVGSILSALLPVVGRLESGVQSGKVFKSGDSGTVDIVPDTLLRLQTIASIPKFNKYTLGGTEQQFDGAVVIGGAIAPNQGLVPLGLTAGVDKHTTTSTTDMMPDGIVDPVGMTGAPGELPLRLAPLHGGIEGSKYTVLALGANLSGLLGGLGGGGDSGSSSPLILSGRIVFKDKIKFQDNGQAANKIAIPDFMLPADVTLDDANRKVAVQHTDGAGFYRLDLTTSEGGEWQVYFAPAASGETDVQLPTPPASFEDRLLKTASGSTKLPTATLQTVSLAGKAGLDYQSVVKFDSDNANDLTAAIDAFTAHGITRTTPTP